MKNYIPIKNMRELNIVGKDIKNYHIEYFYCPDKKYGHHFVTVYDSTEDHNNCTLIYRKTYATKKEAMQDYKAQCESIY